MGNEELIEPWNRFIHEGDLDALSQVYFHNYDVLFTYGLKITSDKQIVEDAIQNVFINLIKHRKNIGTVKNQVGYLVNSLRHQLFSDLNSRNKMVPVEQISEEQFDYFRSPEQELSDSENRELIHVTVKKCIENLSAKQREIIFLRFESKISYEEIAEMLDISVGSCYKSVYRSVKTIRSEVEKILGNGGNLILWIWSGLTR